MLFFVALNIKMPVNPQENQMFRPSNLVNMGSKFNPRPGFQSDSDKETPNARKTGNQTANVNERYKRALSNGV